MNDITLGFRSFSKLGHGFAKQIADKTFSEKQAAYIDELGSLELQGKELYLSFLKLLAGPADIFAVCRESCMLKWYGSLKLPNTT